MSKTVRPAFALPSLALLVLAVAACGGSPSTTGSAASTHASATVSQSATQPSVSATPSSTAPSKPSASPSKTTTKALVTLHGYHYTPLPAELRSISTSLTDTGAITAVTARGVAKGSHTEPDFALFLATYNPKLTARLDKLPISKVLDGAAKGFKAFADAHATTSDHVLSGTHVRLIVSSQVAIAVAYERGGTLVEIIGPPKSAEALRFARVYFGAGG